jgi:transposase
MSRKERERLVVLSRMKEKELSRAEGAAVLGLSHRQMQRIYLRWRKEGDGGLLHRSRGKASARRIEAGARERALALYRSKLVDFGPTLFAEKLGLLAGIWVSHDTTRRWLKAEGLVQWSRRARRSRRRRQRKERFGELVQMDGSFHAWFEARGPESVLMTAIDDATGRRRSLFCAAETTESAMACFANWCREFGVPQGLYVDQHSIYRSDRQPTAD